MTSATVNSVTTTFAYRGDGLRDSRTTGGNTTTFTWDIAGGLPVVLDDGAKYVYGAGMVSQVSGANTYYYLADGLGSTMKTVDATGAVVNGYTYDIYGKKTSSTGSQANEFDFAGQQTDPTGLQYLRARYYDPETGTFVSRDPLSASPGWFGNPFGYAGANAVNHADPTGLFPPVVPGMCQLLSHFGCKVIEHTERVVKTAADGIVRLVNLGGEYAVRFGEAAVGFIMDHPAEFQFALEAALGAALAACWAAVVSGPVCTAVIVPAYSVLQAWKLADTIDSDSEPPDERVIKLLLNIVQAVPTGGAAKAIFDVLADWLANPVELSPE